MARARHVQIIGDKTVMIAGRLITDRPADAAERVFLGLDGEGNSWSAGSSAATSNLHDLRSLALEAALPPDLIGILADVEQRRERESHVAGVDHVRRRRGDRAVGLPRHDPRPRTGVRHIGST